jgi:acyl-CoA synthetase (AMP-forming)/AMP-acid ligase II
MAPEHVAVVYDEGRLTYAELAERSWRLADRLRSMGIGPGDRVAYLGANHPCLYETLFAATAIGAIFVPLNWRLTATELTYMIDDCGAPVLVYAPEHEEVVRQLVAASPALRYTFALGGPFDTLLAAGDPAWVDVDAALDDPAFILYTSGTTGRPKGVMLSHANVTWNCVNVLIDTGLAADAVSLVCSPLFHSAALDMVSMPAIMTGGTIVLMGQFDPSTVFRLIEQHRVSLMFGVPAMFNAMAQHERWPTADLSSLRYVLCGGAPVPLPVIETYLTRGVLLLQGYGLTETAPGALFLVADRALDKAGTAGVPSFFTDVRVVRPDGGDVMPGERGEVVIAGPNVMLGYWGLPDATAAAIDDGWFHSGDVAVVDEDGYVTIVDRLKDMIISGGENISPAEIESVLHGHPAVADCAVIAVADERWGEVGRAVVVLLPDAAVTEAELLEHIGASLARYKVPKSVVFADELPRSGAGKVLKNVVRQRFGVQAKS